MMKSRLRNLILFIAISAPLYADDGHDWRAHYLANAGVMIARGETKILFDPFFRNDYGRFDLMPEAMEAAIFAGTPPWDGVDAVFISHHHDDHFDPAMIRDFLQKWPAVQFYAPQQVVALLLALDGSPAASVTDRIHGLELQRDSAAVRLDMGGLIIEAVHIAHGGWPDRNAEVDNIVFRVTLDQATTVMHMGDADAARELYVPHESYWQAHATDLALVPVWLMLTDKGRYVLDEYVDAGHEIGMHVYDSIPERPADRPASFDGLDIFTIPGETRQFALKSDALVSSVELDIKEWQVPYENTVPRDPFVASATSVWFVGQGGGYLANLNVETGEFARVPLKKGSGPHNLIVGSDGIVWYAGNLNALIGRYDPATQKIEEIPMPDAAARDPHTLIFDKAEEHIWFTVQNGNMMGRLNVATRKVDLIKSQTPGSRPYGIKLAPDGSVWVVLFGSNKLAHINANTLEHLEIELPRAGARPRRLEVLADGRVWYVDYAAGMLGVYDPANKTFKEWQMPQGEGSRPYGMASDASGNLWMVATGVQPNQFMGFDPATETYFAITDVPSGGGNIRHMHYHKPSAAVWFGTDTNYIGRVIVEGKVAE